MAAATQKNDLIKGAKVSLDANGILYSSEIKEIHQGVVHVTPLKDKGIYAKLLFNQPVYLMQETAEGTLVFVLLRFVQHSFKGEPADIFKVVRSTFHVAAGDVERIPMCSWCDLTIFSIFNRERTEFSGRVQMFELSENGLGVVITREIPYDTFAECEFDIGGTLMKIPSRCVHGISSDNGAYHRMYFEYVCISKKERLKIRQYLFAEQARRLREG